MKTRIISGILMLPLLIVVWLGGIWITALCILIGFIGIREFYNGFEAMDVHPSYSIAYVALFFLYLVNGLQPESHELILAWIALVIVAGSIYMFNTEKRDTADAMATILGIIYVEFFSFHVVLTDGTGEYHILIWLIFLSAFGADIFAYFTGLLIGKHKLCPTLSPKKTTEGAIGGVIGATAVCCIFAAFFCDYLMMHCLIIGCLGSIISMFGDLTASAYKRKMGIKDYGNLIPGHGGVMDRIDSVLFTAPFVYYYIRIVLVGGVSIT